MNPVITTTSKSGHKQMTVLGSGGSKDFYFTPQPGLWCSNQSEEVIQKLFAAYEKEPCTFTFAIFTTFRQQILNENTDSHRETPWPRVSECRSDTRAVRGNRQRSWSTRDLPGTSSHLAHQSACSLHNLTPVCNIDTGRVVLQEHAREETRQLCVVDFPRTCWKQGCLV